jgi:integral membrane sensor domain MASE1
MQELSSSFTLLLSRKDSSTLIILSTLVFLFLLVAVQNGADAVQALGFDSLPVHDRLSLSMRAFFDIQNTFTPGTLILAVLGSLLSGVNLSLAYTYVRIRGEMIVKSGVYSGVGLFLAILGIGCAACGTAFLSLLLGFFGFSTMLTVLPYQGLEIGYIGLFILLFATYSLARKMMSPLVC